MAQLTSSNNYRDIRPLAPARPTLWSARHTKPLATPVAAVTDLPHVAWFSNGRSAIAHAAMLAGVTSGSTVLMPAYHCESMVAPAAWLGAKVKLYRIRQNLEIDLDHLQAIADDNTRLILYPQYFGHRRPAQALCRISREKGWTLIEDCAHAFFTVGDRNNLGADADFVIASSSKFLAAFDGGVLASRYAFQGWPETHRPGVTGEVQALVEALEYAFEYGRLPRMARVTAPILAALRHLRRMTTDAKTGSMPASRFGGSEFEPDHVCLGATILARWLAKLANRRSIAAARRENWEILRNRLEGSPRLSFPINSLGPQDVPYALAVELREPNRAFPELKRRGVPVYRWESAFSGCEGPECDVSRRFRQSLIQIPCHQSLTKPECEWIADTIMSVI